ncbi:T9SS type A sorting domain-containing protein [Hymenobacter glacialis]|uniref:Fibronectin type-III domain-containing protein n=1 Tax=Hymenobacter glacialis TaxID=1908236 RepID=A0A1G1TBV6_9BACT|nr:T9SS type A sorting domain-containing protein [Hymenobacter glacialis]OGX88353.1 hypothetical protein BEN48_09720 [Hymenobacter glacialis]
MIFFILAPTAGQAQAPTIATLSTNSATAGSLAVPLTVTGTNFQAPVLALPGSVVLFNATPLATTVVSGTQLEAVIPATLLALPSASNRITVLNPTGLTSNALNFAVTATATVCLAVSTPVVSVVNSTTVNVEIPGGNTTTTGPYTVTATPLLGAVVTVNATVAGTVAVPGLLPATSYLITVTGTCPAAAGGSTSPPSVGVSITTPAAPTAPAQPVAVVVQPTCLLASGSVTVTAPVSGATYTLVGVGATASVSLTSASGVFTGLAPGAYRLSVSVNGLVSAALAVTIDAVPSVPAQPVAVVVQPTSGLATGSVSVTAPLSGATYALVGIGVSLTSATGIFTNLTPGAYSLSVTLNGCVSTALDVTINATPTVPTLPVAVVVHPTCLLATGSLTVTAPLSNGTYTLIGTGVSLTSATGIFTGLAPGAYTLRVAVNGQVSAGLAVTINAVPTAPAQPIAVVVQPTCLLATGSVTVTAALSGGVYTLIGTNISLTSTTGVFTDLAPGTYSLSAALDRCVGAAVTVTIKEAPTALAVPVAVVVQPTCLLASGSVSVTASLSDGVYTLMGAGASLTSTTGVFTGLAPGTYSLSVALNGCVSAALAVTIDAVPAAPAQPIVTIVQPTSVLVTGSVTVTSPLSGGTYTLVGVGVTAGVSLTSAAGVFTNLAPGTYGLSVALDGCTSPALAVTINAAPMPTPIVTIVQPTCLLVTGSVSVTAPLSGGTYTLVGVGATAGVSLTSAAGVFTNLAPGTYSLSVAVNGSVSAALAVTINAVPAAPARPIAVVVQPTSVLATGSVTVTSLLSGATYTLVGVGATAGVSLTSATGAFTGLAAGSYSLSATLNGCVSLALDVTINAVTVLPTLPVAVVVQPTCVLATGSVTVTAPLSGGVYTLVGAGVSLTSATGVFTGLAPGAYTLRVAVNGQVSAGLAVTITSTTATISVTSKVTAVACFGSATGQVQLQATGGTAPYTFTLNGGLSNSSGLFTALKAGTYVVIAQDSKGCAALASSVTITQPVLGLNVTFSQVVNACVGTAGQIPVSATGGTAPYTYQLRLAATGSVVATSPAVTSGFTFTGLSANAYRLFVVDASGCEAECATQPLITTACLKLTELDVYPNPFSNQATAEFQVAEGERYSLAIYDSAGRLVRRVSEGVGEANRVYQVPVGSYLAEGNYQVRLVSGSTVQTVRVHAQ